MKDVLLKYKDVILNLWPDLIAFLGQEQQEAPGRQFCHGVGLSVSAQLRSPSHGPSQDTGALLPRRRGV